MEPGQIRNFTIIGHIDHGKSTLADRMLEATGTVANREMREQYLDKLDLERERGVTIKLQTVRMQYTRSVPRNPTGFSETRRVKKVYTLNLIDTPGHVDFAYEVSRSLAACEGAVLIIDAAQGIQAQTLANYFKAREAGLTIIPVINKIDLPNAEPKKAARQINQTLGFKLDEIHCISAKTGQGVPELLTAIIQRVPAPRSPTNPQSQSKENILRALIFDSFYDEHKGVVALVRVVDGKIKSADKLKLMMPDLEFEPLEIGFLTAAFKPTDKILTGEVGYLATGIKDIQKVRVGDTVTKKSKIGEITPLPGYQIPKPLVLANLFPAEDGQANDLRTALEKLSLNDASLTYQPIFSKALGPGFRCGFLGLFHLTIIQARLAQELNTEVVVTTPIVEYRASQEPWVKLEIFTPQKYLGSLMQLCQNRRGVFLDINYLEQGKTRRVSPQPDGFGSSVRLIYELPLAELITNFTDRLKSLSAGYASFDYQFLEYRDADLVRVSVLVNHRPLDELSFTTVRQKAEPLGRRMVEQLSRAIPRQQFKIPVQAAIGGKIIARANIPALRKDVTAKLYGGDRTRKDKLLKKQTAGKKRLKKFGRVEVPQEAFLAVLKN